MAEKVGEVFVEVKADLNKLKADMALMKGHVTKVTTTMADKFKSAGRAMTIAGAVITAAFGLTVKAAMSLEKELAQVATMLDKTTMDYMPKYKTGLQKLSVEFGEATSTLSRGLYDILSASIAPSKALDVLAIAAKAASAGITDTGTAADAITTIINSYGMAAEDAGEVSDKLFAIVKRGKTTFAELAPAIGKSAALASQSGLSFDDLGASIATLTRAGIRTDEAMTAVNGVLRSFLKPADDAKEAAREMGLELSTNTLKTEGLTGVMEKLTDATAEQLAAIFPNIRGLKGIGAALGDAAGYASDYRLMLESAGLTEEAFQKQTDTLAFQLGQLKQAMNVIAVTIGDILIPPLKNLTEKAVEVAGKIKEWAEAHKPLMDWIVKIGATLGIFAAIGGPILLAASAFLKAKAAIDAITFALKLMNIRIGTTGMLTTGTLIPALGKLNLALAPLVIQFALIAANVYIWIEVIKELNKVLRMHRTTAEDVKEATDILDEAQRKLAEKLGITVEELKKFQKSGASVSEMMGKELIPKTEEAVKTFGDFLEEIERMAGIGELLQPAEEAIKKIIDTMTPYEKQLEAINERYDEAIEKIATYIKEEKELKIAIDRLNAGREAEITLLDRQKTAMEKLNEAKKKLADLTKSLTDKIYEFTHTEYEVSLRDINREYDLLVENAKKVFTTQKELTEAIKIINEERQEEIDGLKESNELKEEAIEVNEELIESYDDIGKEFDKLTEKTEKYIGTFMTLSEVIEQQAKKWDKLKSEMAEGVGTLGGSYREAFEGGGGGFSGSPPSGFGYQYGTPYVPRTGMALLHRGEAVIPANQNNYNTSNTQNNTINIPSQGGNVQLIAKAVEKVLYETGRQFKRRGFEIIPGRG